MCQSELTEFLAELTEFAAELSEFSLPKQCSRNSIPPVSLFLIKLSVHFSEKTHKQTVQRKSRILRRPWPSWAKVPAFPLAGICGQLSLGLNSSPSKILKIGLRPSCRQPFYFFVLLRCAQLYSRIFRVSFWQNGFFADFYFWAARYFADFVAGFFSSSLWEKCPEKSSRKIPRRNPPKFIQQKSPTHFCRGAQFYSKMAPNKCTSSGCVCVCFFSSFLPSESSDSPSKLGKKPIFLFTHWQICCRPAQRLETVRPRLACLVVVPGNCTGAEIAQLCSACFRILAKCTQVLLKAKEVTAAVRSELPDLVPPYRETLEREGNPEVLQP